MSRGRSNFQCELLTDLENVNDDISLNMLRKPKVFTSLNLSGPQFYSDVKIFEVQDFSEIFASPGCRSLTDRVF